MKRANLEFIVLTICAFLLLIGCRKPGDGDGADSGHQHASESEHDDEPEPAGEGLIRLSETEMKEFRVSEVVAGPRELNVSVTLLGEIQINPDRQAHVVPRVSGIVREAFKTIGDQVSAGELLAVIESRELAEAKAAYLAAIETASLAESTFKREETLRQRNISSEKDFLDARADLAAKRIALQTTRYQLYALGFSANQVSRMTEEGEDLTRFEITAPFAGTVLDKHITRGEIVDGSLSTFTIIDLSEVWVHLSVFQKDIEKIQAGQQITIRHRHGGSSIQSHIDYLSPVVEESTRTATARVVLKNSDGRWRPGTFVNGAVQVDKTPVQVAAPMTAFVMMDGNQTVFAATDGGYTPRSVTVGRKDAQWVEIVSGLKAGERVIGVGAFLLKSEVGRAAMEAGGHGH